MSRDSFVLDASALLALVNQERGADRVASALQTAVISAVNYSESVTKLCERGIPKDDVLAQLGDLKLKIIPFDASQAEVAGALRLETRHLGLSFGDRACLALANVREAIVLTGERAWSNLDIGLRIELIR